MHLAGEASKLVVIADSEIRAVPLHHCDNSQTANSCVSCVALQDPHCAWDDVARTCVAVPTKLHDNDASKTLFQDIINGKHKGCGYYQGKKIYYYIFFYTLSEFYLPQIASLPAPSGITTLLNHPICLN